MFGLCLHFKQVKTDVPPPTFCYILSAHPSLGQIEIIEEDPISKLYQPPILHYLREILQVMTLFLTSSFNTYFYQVHVLCVMLPIFVNAFADS
jgi:hypothetical protein